LRHPLLQLAIDDFLAHVANRLLCKRTAARVAYMPVISDERAGAHTGLVANAFVKRTDSPASRSRFGVGTVSSP